MKIYIDTLGCPKNISDSEHAAGLLTDNGHIIVNDLKTADAILINTCGFINDAKEESIDRILMLSQQKKDGAILIVSGCLSQRYKNDFSSAMPEADIVIGVNDYNDLPKMLDEYTEGAKLLSFSASERKYSEMGTRKSLGVNYSSYLKISEGCDNVCTYCIIPFIRGGYRSRDMDNIIDEARDLTANGCKELILIAQDVTAYGIDLYGEYCLPELLRRLCEIPDLRWIRLMYCYEERITDELISVMAENEKICKYIDIPIQHASDKILKAMNRRSTHSSIEKTIKRLRNAIPGIHIRTTLITGFPGETQEDAIRLEEFIQNERFERLGVFTYSKEEGTEASKMSRQVPEKIKSARRDRLMLLQQQISLEHNLQKIGDLYEVLVESIEDEGVYIGRTAFDSPEIDNKVIFTSNTPLLPGDFVTVKIDDGFDYDLSGCAIDVRTESEDEK